MRNIEQITNFQYIVNEIKTSYIYENHENWKLRELNPSDEHIVNILRTSTNSFLAELENVNNLNSTLETKLNEISDLVDELPWSELDTEEKEFLADTLTPAIKAAGFDPWSIF